MQNWQILPDSHRIPPIKTQQLAQVALRAPTEVALQCVAGHCYYHRSVFFSLFLR